MCQREIKNEQKDDSIKTGWRKHSKVGKKYSTRLIASTVFGLRTSETNIVKLFTTISYKFSL